MTHHELSSPFNWCDRNCERCPLASVCPLPAESARWEHLPLPEAVVAVFQECIDMLEAEAAAQGISLEDLPPRPPPPLEAQLLSRAAEVYLRAVAALGPRGHALGEPALLINMKVARLGSYLLEDCDGVWQLDGVPNLLLLEHLLAVARARAEAAPLSPAERARLERSERELRVLLAPLFERITGETRDALAVLVRAGRAPSPFCTSSR